MQQICQICGAPLYILTKAHCRLHGITKEEYIKKFGEFDYRNRRQRNLARSSPKRTEYEEYMLTVKPRR